MALRIPRLRINRLWLVLGGAIVMALLAAWLSTGYLKNREKLIEADLAEKAKGGPSLSVVVATSDLPKGTIAEGKLMAARDVPTDLLYEDVVLAEQFDTIEGKKLIKPILKGRPLRKSDVFDDSPRDLATDVTPGNRALTIDIDELNSFAQTLRAGSYVDLYLMAQNPSTVGGSTEIRPLLPKVKIIATGTTLQTPAQMEVTAPGQVAKPVAYSNITVDVTPENAVRIALASQAGKIRALLRKPDAEDLQMSELSIPDLFDGEIAAKAKTKGRKVTYIVGGGGTGTTAPQAISLPNIPGMPSIPGLTAPSVTQVAPPGAAGMAAAAGVSIPVAPTGAAR